MSDELSPYERLGGAAGTRRLVDHFYDAMEQLPEAATIRALHPADMADSRQKLYEFLSGWLGGPPLYVQKRGHPRMRMRHLPFTIGDVERDQWMHCMRQALEQCVPDAELRELLQGAFQRMADHMRNQQGD